MRPAILSNDIIIYSKWSLPEIIYGDIVLMDYEERRIIKRIIGLPGDKIEIDSMGRVIRNEEELKESEVIFGYQDTADWMEFPVVVPEESYFFLGDNRPVSLDSRTKALGFIKKEGLIGKVLMIFRLPFRGR